MAKGIPEALRKGIQLRYDVNCVNMRLYGAQAFPRALRALLEEGRSVHNFLVISCSLLAIFPKHSAIKLRSVIRERRERLNKRKYFP